NEALPIGNGRLGAMVHGRTATEMLCLNEDSVWYGGPQQRSASNSHKHLPHLRQLIRDGKHMEAGKIVEKRFMCNPWSQRHYEPLGNVMLDFGHNDEDITAYKRTLDLENAVTTVEYLWQDRVHVIREIIDSYPDNVLALRIKASEEIGFVIRMSRLSHIGHETNEFLDSVEIQDGNKLVMFVTPGGGKSVRACCILGVKVDDEGQVEATNSHLVVRAKEALVLIAARTTFRHPDDFDTLTLKDLSVAFENHADLWRRHKEDHRSNYGRMHLHLGPPVPEDTMSTNERLSGTLTPSLITLYHNYARCLLLSSSRSSPSPSLIHLDLPANLQGIWNPSFAPAWGSKFTININIQMNHFPTFVCNLPSTALPLFALVERVAKNGEHTAREVYGCRGWCCHSSTDIWADTDVADRWMPASLWPLGGIWLCLIIWEHYVFTLDLDILKRMFPFMKGAVEFMLDFLVEDEAGEYLVTNPSLSPENTFVDADGKEGRLCEGSSMDISIVSALFSAFLAATAELSFTDQTVSEGPTITAVRSAQARLSPLKVSDVTGRIQEWGHKNDYTEAELGHRHTSHLFALYPGSTISPSQTPLLATSARKVLLHRSAHAGGHTGWSRAWLLLFWARLGDKQQVAEHTGTLLNKSTLPNLLNTHPPFQIDGNFGGGAGIVEAIVQSHEIDELGRRIVRLLPACPWNEGEVKNVGVRGGWDISFRWKEGRIAGKAKIKAVPRGFEEDTNEEWRLPSGEKKRVLVIVFPDHDGNKGPEVEVRIRGVWLASADHGIMDALQRSMSAKHLK
ncbi:Six-hairpin glycosidase-like protein, partial [Delphinella strobiligena]